MKFSVVCLSALFCQFASFASAETIIVGPEHLGPKPTIIRGAPLRCHGNRTLVINVEKFLNDSDGSLQHCDNRTSDARPARANTVINIIVIAGRDEHYYIKHH